MVLASRFFLFFFLGGGGKPGGNTWQCFIKSYSWPPIAGRSNYMGLPGKFLPPNASRVPTLPKTWVGIQEACRAACNILGPWKKCSHLRISQRAKGQNGEHCSSRFPSTPFPTLSLLGSYTSGRTPLTPMLTHFTWSSPASNFHASTVQT